MLTTGMERLTGQLTFSGIAFPRLASRGCARPCHRCTPQQRWHGVGVGVWQSLVSW